MANKNYQVNLMFNANVSSAQKELQKLSDALQKAYKTPNTNPMANAGLTEGLKTARELESILRSTVNMDTGKLNLTGFTNSLKNSNLSVEKIHKNLSAIGPVGEESFQLLAKSIANAETDTLSLNKKISNFLTNLKKVAQWEISSKAVHGLESMVSNAYHYAQDLNESLNNIRIVTGQNTEQMAKFAVEANKAAKALKTTTTNYTDASLIYYQQGLSDKEVLERTDITIKMANVARSSAEDVSDQMTAVWNNFYDGSKSLEYYADVMTALGAATASSTEEISAGLNKFAAVAETVGLSYEYAASALATVTSTTRESADTVGTAFKTLFARIQDLELGETLDDGTTLGTYSESLAKVGINIKNTNGEIKEMDTILEEMAAKWKVMDKDAQVALAQNVAGVRQYTQLIALMDNWDFFQENLQTSLSATGTLNEQAEIYAESWEAASKEVTASMEELYSKIINDEAFVKLTHALAGLIDILSSVVEGFGGVESILTTISSLIMMKYAKEIPNALIKFKDNFKAVFGMGQKDQLAYIDKFTNELKTSKPSPENEELIKELSIQKNFILNKKYMTEAQIKEFEQRKENIEILKEERLEYEKLIKAVDKNRKSKVKQAVQNVTNKKQQELDAQIQIEEQKKARARSPKKRAEIDKKITELRESKDKVAKDNSLDQYLENYQKSIREATVASTTLTESNYLVQNLTSSNTVKKVSNDKNSMQKASQILKDYQKKLKELPNFEDIFTEKERDALDKLFDEPLKDLNEFEQRLIAIRKEYDQIDAKARQEKLDQEIVKQEEELKKAGFTQEDFDPIYKETVSQTEAELQYRTGERRIKEGQEDLNNLPQLGKGQKIASALGNVAAVGTTAISTISSVSNTMDVLGDSSATAGDKIFAATGALGNFAASAASLASMVGPVAGIAIAAAVAAITVGVKLWDEYNITAEEALENSKEKADAAAQAYENAKAEVITLEESFDKYTKTINLISRLTRGTEEWNEALQQSNLQVLELLEKYPQLALMENEKGQKATTESFGKLQVADWAYEQLLKEAEQKELITYGANFFAQADVRQKEIDYDRDILLQSLEKIAPTIYNNDGAEITGEIVEKISKNIETLSGKTEEEIKKYLNPILNDYINNSSYYGPIGGKDYTDIDIWFNAIKELSTPIENLKESIDENTRITDLESQAIVNQVLQNNTYIQGSKVAEEVIDKSSDIFTKQYNIALQKLQEDNYGIFKNANKDTKGREIWNNYLEDMNLSPSKYKLLEVKGTKNNRSFTYTDENNKEKTIALEQMIEVRASAQAIEKLGGAAEELTTILMRLATSTNGYDKALKDLLSSGTLNNTTKADYESLVKQFGITKDSTDEEIKTALEKQLVKLYDADGNDVLSEDEKASIERTTGKTFEQNLNEQFTGFKNGEMGWNSIDLSSFFNIDAEQNFLLGLESQLTLRASQALENLFNDINLGPKGEAAGKTFAEGLNTILGSIDEENQVAVLNELANINWSSNDSFEQATSILENYGVKIDLTAEEWESYRESLKLALNVQEDFSAELEKLTAAYTALQGLSFGDIISDDALAALRTYTNLWEDFYMKQADGTTRFIGDSKEMQAQIRKDMAENIAALREKQKLQDGINKQAWGSTLGKVDWSELEGSDLSMIEKMQNVAANETNSAWAQALSNLNYTSEDLARIIEDQKVAQAKYDEVYAEDSKANDEEKANALEARNKANDAVKEFYDRISELESTNYMQELELNAEAYASTLLNLTELQTEFDKGEKGALTKNAYEKQKKYLENLGKIEEENLKKQSKQDRYITINKAMEALEDTINDVSKALDGLYGSERLAQIGKINKLLKEQQELYRQKIGEATSYLELDKDDLSVAFQQLKLGDDIQLQFDEKGNVTNIEAVLKAIGDQQKALIEAKAMGDYTEYSEKVESFREALKQLEATQQIIVDSENAIDDAFKEWQSNNYEKLSYTLEMNIEINDMELEEIDYYLNKISDDFKKMGEAAGLALDKFAHMEESLKDQGDFYNDLTTAYNRGEISPADYVAGMKEARSAIYENLEAIQELSKEMQEYYGKTLDAFGEKIDENIDRMESMTSVLDHYKNIMGILGKEQDYSRIGIILQGTAETLKDQIEVIRAEYQFYVNEVNEKHALMEQAKAEGNQEVIDLYTKQWEQARDAMIETQDQMLSKTAEWAEAMKAITENKLSKFGEELEKALTGGASFEDMELSLKRTNSLQEEFLTTTNKIYETEKMMRTAQNAIDISTNRVAKQKLQNFIQETKQLQNQGELSKYELEIQQAKYDLLVAEIALKDAQDAKTTVRLRRDAEGNVGYVYTADQQKVNNALQNFEDAQNALYNIGLEGANTYSEKYQQTLQEMHATLTEINTAWLNGEITSEEEYNRKMLEAKEYYYELLSDYSSLYQVALTTDSAVVRDAWMDDHIDMINNTEEWQLAVDEYTMLSGEAMQEWQSIVNQVEKDTGLSYSKIQQSVKSVKDESNALRDAINGDNGLIKAMGEQINEVDKVVDKYVKEWMPKVIALTDQYEKLAKKIKEAISAESGASSLSGGTEVKEFDKTTDAYQAGYKAGYTLGYEQGYAGTGDKYQVSNHADYNYKKGYDHGYAKGWADGERQREADKKNGSELKYNVEKKNEGYKSAVALMGFDTGGYTGSWGPDGKLAVLHQKEIVLNAADTSNLLASVDLLHNILQVIDVQSMTRQLSGILSSPQFFNNNSQTLEQQVYIEAHFPDATDRNELEAAFNNIINQASQYANRK